MGDVVDVLMITHRRPHYTQITLPRLAEQCLQSNSRLWLWHNGDDVHTRAVVEGYREHPAVHRIHLHDENAGLVTPTNWVWEGGGDGGFVSKVDDDCLLPDNWITVLRDAHKADAQLGAIGCSRLQDEDIIPLLARRKVQTRASGVQVWRNCWVQGSGYLMKRQCIEDLGLLGGNNPSSFSTWCVRLARKGWVNGFYWPLLREDHMDDPRSPNTALIDDQSIEDNLPLTARRLGVSTLEEWLEEVRRNARFIQEAPTSPFWHHGIGRKIHRAWSRMRHSAKVAPFLITPVLLEVLPRL